MSKGYLINNVLEFWPEEHSLVSRGAERKTISINVPASRCFLLLLERRSDLVPQHDFFNFVWGDAGDTVPPNTLYQNISILRRGLKAIIEQPVDLVVTVPKQGFKLNEGAEVVEIDSVNKAVPNAILPLEDKESTANKSSPQLNEAPLPAVTIREGNLRRWYAMLALLLLAITAAHYYLLTREKDFTPYFNSYTALKNSGQCHIYVNDDAEDYTIHQKALQMINLNCRLYPYVYVTAYQFIPVVSLITCNKPFDERKKTLRCASYNLRGVYSS
ncbi:winged helix-turn-helix domain-containing protein [Serratia rubidaea]|nr:winged helix-turn-helix domain-containing protein [Serratia rubidaea]